ncbi:phage portal protein [Tritonibacter horizontis]|uniref:Phage portal protein n=1 Tax=Tritonibacter horizontis TaxID=1768241 RepID=A0A132BUQ6_9RHOB|nr:phage portal protein [Tritonibacter horizontis]KUP91792.1 phage portal protein [Tritonibacter horizontis]
MGLKSLFRREVRVGDATAEARAQVVADSGMASITEVLSGEMPEGVTMKEAMSLPAVWDAINFLSAAMAGLPIEVFEKTGTAGGDRRVTGGVADVLAEAVNDSTTSFSWRETFFSQVFGPGRAYTYIERNRQGRAINLFPMEHDRTSVRKVRGRLLYDYLEPSGTVKTYEGKDVIDLAYLLRPDHVTYHNPVMTCASAIRQGLNANRYALTVFGKNGVPPYVLKGPFSAAKEMMRAAADLMKVTRRAAEEGKPVLPLPSGHDLVRLGDDPEKMQLTPVQVFAVGQVARIYQLPPVFLQELSKGNYNNIEHQDLHLVKHTLRRWVEKFEQELTLKIFGRGARRYVKLDLDGITRGDFKTRIEAIVRAVQNSLLTPNEGREMMKKPPLPGGDTLFIQGATVPLALAGKAFARGAADLAADEEAAPEEGADADQEPNTD